MTEGGWKFEGDEDHSARFSSIRGVFIHSRRREISNSIASALVNERVNNPLAVFASSIGAGSADVTLRFLYAAIEPGR